MVEDGPKVVFLIQLGTRVKDEVLAGKGVVLEGMDNPRIGVLNLAGDQGRGRGRQTPSPVTFPSCRYSFSNPPTFNGKPQGSTFSIWRTDKATALTYFSFF